MLRKIKKRLHEWGKLPTTRREIACEKLLNKEFSSVNFRGIKPTIVIDKYKVVYNTIHKNGSTSMVVLWNTVLSGAVEHPKVALRKMRRIATLNESEIRDLKTYRWLLIVRNPYARAMSAFFDKFRREKITSIFPNFALTPEGFKDFVRWLEDGNLDKNSHWDLQTNKLLLPVEAYSDILRLENLHNDAPAFLRKVGVPVDKLDFKAAYESGSTHQTGADSKMLACYDDDTQERVYRLFETDFINFGYGQNLDGTPATQGNPADGRRILQAR